MMKRSSDEEYMVSQIKRPKLQPIDPSGQTSASTGTPSSGIQKLTTHDALAYLKDVKEIFKDKKGKYGEFLEVMKDFKAQRIDTAGVISRVKELFKGHRNLILGFNAFLPKGYEITLSPEEEFNQKKPVEFEEAITFVNKIKTRFQGDDHVYKSFLHILNMYRGENKSIREVYTEVAMLFQNHSDLLVEFTRFLPDQTASQHAPSGRAFVQQDERNSGIIRHGPTDKRDVELISHDDDGLSVDCPSKDHGKPRKGIEKEKDCKEDKALTNCECDEKDLGYANMDLEKWTHESKSAQKLADFVADPLQKAGVFVPEFTFWEKAKKTLSIDAYQEFLKCIDIYSKEIISRAELKSLVDDILGKYPELKDGFNEFLADGKCIDGFLEGAFTKRHSGSSLKVEDREKVRERETDREKVRDGDIKRDEERGRSKDSTALKVSSPAKDRYNRTHSISELDLSGCQNCTPSYRLLPKNSMLPPASYRTEIGDVVLNDAWVSVTSGSEDYSFKHMRKNQYEESLFRCEDDRYELDMLLESVNITTKRVEELLLAMQDNATKPESQLNIEDHFSALNLRCIERLYGDHGLDVMVVLKKNPNIALPVILSRLKQKQEEWSKCRADFNKVWAEIFAKNYHKSLDHRSFYFKQQDTKSLSTKALLAEIKEVNDSKRKENDILFSVPAGNRQLVVANMEFDYTDSEIHEDLYQIIKYSCREVCSSVDQMNKVIHIWTSFLEPMMGVHPRAQGADDTEDIVKAKCHITKTGVTGSRDRCTDIDSATDDAMRLKNHVSVIESKTTRKSISCRGKLSDRENIHKESAVGDDQIAGGRETCCTTIHEKLQNDLAMADEISGSSPLSATPERRMCPGSTIRDKDKSRKKSLEIASGTDIVTVPGQIGPEKVLEARSGDVMRPTIAANQARIPESIRTHRPYEGSLYNDFKSEREEGELSPNGECEEDNFIAFEEVTPEAAPRPEDSPPCGNHRGRNGFLKGPPREIEGDNDAGIDCGEESADMEDHEHASETGEGISASESGDGECSRQGHEEDEEEDDDDDDDDDADHDDHDEKAESEGEVDGMAEAHDADEEGISLPFSERFLHKMKPLAKHIPSALSVNKEHKGSQIFFGNDSFYVLFRLHHILYERILSAKVNSSSAERKWRSSKETGSDLFAKFMSALYSLLDGSADNTRFEDECRAIIGTQSYVLFTLDKLIYKIVKQLQAVASDETDNKLLQLYAYERSRRPEQFVDLIYHENARILLHDESIYRIECSLPPAPTHLSIQLMGCRYDKPEVTAVSVDPGFASYLSNNLLCMVSRRRKVHDIFLSRNKRKNTKDEEDSATCNTTKGVLLINGLECKISCSSSKVSYVLGTEDIFYCKKNETLYGDHSCRHNKSILFRNMRVRRFRRFLSRSII